MVRFARDYLQNTALSVSFFLSLSIEQANFEVFLLFRFLRMKDYRQSWIPSREAGSGLCLTYHRQSYKRKREPMESSSAGEEAPLTEGTITKGATSREVEAQTFGGTSGQLLNEVHAQGVDLCNQDEAMRNDLSLKESGTDYANEVDENAIVLSSKKRAFMDSSLKALHKKRDKLLYDHRQLSLQQRQLEDAIAVCEKDIQTIIEGGDGISAVVVDTIIEACDLAASKADQLQCDGIHAGHEGKPSVHGTRRKTISEENIGFHNAREELDGLCKKNN